MVGKVPLHLKQTFPHLIWIFTESEGDGIESRLPFKIFSTLSICMFVFQITKKDSFILCNPRVWQFNALIFPNFLEMKESRIFLDLLPRFGPQWSQILINWLFYLKLLYINNHTGFLVHLYKKNYKRFLKKVKFQAWQKSLVFWHYKDPKTLSVKIQFDLKFCFASLWILSTKAINFPSQ